MNPHEPPPKAAPNATPTREREPAPGKAVLGGKTVILALLGAIVVAAGAIFWVGVSGGSQHVPLSQPGVAFEKQAIPGADAGADASP